MICVSFFLLHEEGVNDQIISLFVALAAAASSNTFPRVNIFARVPFAVGCVPTFFIVLLLTS